jgi:SAM-dependent methyltransferase
LNHKIVCPVCKKDEAVKLFEKEGWIFVQCKEDQLVYINPQPDKEELKKIYNTYGKEIFLNPELISICWDYPDYRKRFLDYRLTNRLLEIGVATGGFLEWCRKDGWDTYGVELSAPSSLFAREQKGLNVVTGSLHEAGYPNEFFDIAVAWQTIEHITNPREIAEEVYRILRPGGFFVLSVPCWEGLSIRLLGKRYRYIGRDHLFYFSPRNMERMLRGVGFSKVVTKTGGFNPISWYQDATAKIMRSQKNLAEKVQRMNSLVIRFRTTPFLKGVHRIYYKIIEALNLGDTLFAEALKE